MKKPSAPPVDHRIEIFTYDDISKQTGIPPHVLRRVARKMGIEQTIFMRSSYGRVSPASKKVGVRERNLGRLIKAAAADQGAPYVKSFERDLAGTFESTPYGGLKGKRAEPISDHDADQLAQMAELEKKLGLK